MKLHELADGAFDWMISVDDAVATMVEPCQPFTQSAACHAISKLGDQPELRVLSAGVIIAGIAKQDDRLVRAGARMMIAHEAATFIKGALKVRIDRKRPRSARAREEVKPRKGNHKGKELSSFPSGHSAGGIAVARAFGREYPEYGTAAVIAASAIALLQITRAAHYPSDVVAGVAIGLAAEAATAAGWRGLDMDERSET